MNKFNRTITRKDIRRILGSNYLPGKQSKRFKWYELLKKSNTTFSDKVLTSEPIKAISLTRGICKMKKNEWINLFGDKKNIVPVDRIVADKVNSSIDLNSGDIKIDGKPLEEYIVEAIKRIQEEKTKP